MGHDNGETHLALVEPSQLSANVTDKAIQDMKEQRQRMISFINTQLKEGIDHDYAVIPGTKKKSLLKPGAEKLANLFRLGSRIVSRDREVDRDKGFAFFTYTVELFSHQNGSPIAQCEGSANSEEKSFKKKGPALEQLNSLMKMAQKRAYVGAVIIAVGASDYFTQDLEGKIEDDNEKRKEIERSVGKHEQGDSLMCCNRQMMVSKYDEGMLYCITCRKKKPI